MKLKYLFSASAMLALMAACSNEVETLTNEMVADRPSAGQVEIVSTFGDADSRASWTGAGWKFNEETDRFGVMLMDTWNQTNEGQTTIDDYTFVDYIHTNYPFHSEDGGYTWQSPENAPLSEGNYFFTFPFDPTYQHRGRVYFEVPNVQSNVTEAGVVNAAWPVKYYQKYLGYAFIPAQSGVNKVDVSFHSLFANPKFKIMNATGMNIRMIKMLVRTHQDGKAGQPELMPTKLQLAPLSAGFDRVNNDYAAGEFNGAEETAALFSHATTVENGFFGENKLDGVYEYVLDCGDNYVVPAGEFFRLSAVMPAGEYWNFDIYAFVEIQNSEKTTGIIRLTGLDKSDWSNMDTQNGSMQTVLKPGITQVLTASFDANSVANLGLKDFTVVTSEDLAFVVDLKAKDGGRDLVIIKTLGDDVVLTKEVYDLISDVNRKGIKWQIDGTIVIPADAAADAIDQLTTGEGGVKTTIINKGTQVLTKDLVECDVINEGTLAGGVTIYGDVYNAKGAKMSVTNVYGKVNNKGEITVEYVQGSICNGKYYAEKDKAAIAPVVEASATIVTAKGSVRNWANMKLNNMKGGYSWSNKPGATLELLGSDEQFADSGANHEGAVLTISGEYPSFYNLANTGVVNVNANVTMKGTATGNAGEINIAEGATLNGKENVYNYATINVKGKLYDKIYNSGVVNVVEDGLVIVEDKVLTKNFKFEPYDDGMQVEYKSGGDGIIDVTAANATPSAQAAKANNTENIIFAYTVGEEETAKALEAALKARISNKNYGVNEINLTWASTSATKFSGFLDAASNVKAVLIENNLLLDGHTRFTMIEGSGFCVAKGATLTIKNDCALRLADNVNAIINGTLKANNHAALRGDVKVLGTGEVYVETATVEWTKPNFRGTWID